MKSLRIFSVMLGFLLAFANAGWAQDDTWPKTINTQDGSVLKIYEPEPESFAGTTLKTRSAISLLSPDSTEPVFGTYWAVRTVETDRDNRRINVVSVKVPNVKFASNVDANTIAYIKTALETEIPNVEPSLSQDAVLASLQSNTQEKALSKNLENTPPKIIYTSKPAILVVIDGEPNLQHNDSWGLDAVVNTPFTIIKNTDGDYYLYGGKRWYKGSSASGPFNYASRVPSNLSKVQSAVDNANNSDPGFSSDSVAQSNAISDVIVSTIPAELIQTNGKPTLANIDGTNLSYISNSQNDIFLSKDDQQYYVLISGRWYKAPNINGPWDYTAANALPADFAKIPAGSPKDNVLASVAGTNEARDAVMDAQIPQTAKVDRNNATANVTYDGNPDFQPVEGTNIQYAVNTPNSVIFVRGRYYSVDNGVWFESGAPSGPWAVCIDRPDEVDLIPPSCPAYNMKYVYIYDVQPDWVYMGYTPGYLNTYIYGPTVVYGTGYYYRPWRGRYYYPRPYTWGFSMHYNPWYGWSLGYNYGFDWLHVGFGVSAWSGGWRGGWWGPAVYRPPYRMNPYRSYGYYGNRRGGGIYGRPALAGRPAMANRNVRVNNIYNVRRDVITVNNNRAFNPGNRNNNNNRGNGGINGRPAVTTPGNNNNRINNNNRGQVQQPATRPNRNPQVVPNNNITTDREGNVYQRNNGNAQQWQQRQQRQLQPVDNTRNNDLNRQQQLRDRGQQRSQNFQSSRQNENNYGRPAARGNMSTGGRNANTGGGNTGATRGGGGKGGAKR